ncbi:hypothetical protein HDU76_005463 [Blyttiomyces sp. JEL0837]|nr:hypothetical protein HDU76_005463 [Blyttiomyces sp. JEL0837]
MAAPVMIILRLLLSTLLATFVFMPTATTAQGDTTATDYLTFRGTASRMGYFPNANLDPAVVNSKSFGRLKIVNMPDINGVPAGDVYATPLLYTPPNQPQVIVVATQNNNVYVMNADDGTLIAKKNLGPAFNIAQTYLTTTNTGVANARYKLHALDVLTLQSKPNFPVDIEGIPANNDPTHMAYFYAGYHLQRPGLLLMDNVIYGAFGGHCDIGNYTGWVIGIDATSGTLLSSFATATQTGGAHNGAGLWMSGGGIASDSTYLSPTNPKRRMYVVAGNGMTSPTKDPLPGTGNPKVYGMAVINIGINNMTKKISANDFYMPFNYEALNNGDSDFGSGGVSILSDEFSSPMMKRVVVAGGKVGDLYFLDADSLGGFRQSVGGADNVLPPYSSGGAIYSQAGAYPLEGGYIYINPLGSSLKVLKFGISSSGYPSFSLAGQTPIRNGGAARGVSSPQITSLKGQPGSAIDQITGISYPTNKFLNPTIGNGKVYVPTKDGRLFIYGSPTSEPLTAPNTNFGVVLVGSNMTITVNFTALIPVTITNYTLSNTNFTVSKSPSLPVTLQPNQIISFDVTFISTTTGSYISSLNLQTNLGDSALVYAPLRATSQVNAPYLQVQPSVISFSGVITNSGSVTANSIIGNNGAKPLTLTGFTYPQAPFFILNTPAVGTVIASGGRLSISVLFNSTMDGNFYDSFGVSSDGGNLVMQLSGSAAGPPILQLYTQYLNGSYALGLDMEFGNVPAGQSKTLNVVVANIGPSEMIVTKSKLPASGNIIASDSALAEGTQIVPMTNVTIPVTYTSPLEQLNAAPYKATAVFIVNTNDLNSGLQIFTFNGTTISQQLPAALSAWNYLGCLTDNGNPRILPSGQTNGNTNIMTIDLCISTCASKGFTYSGLEFSQECWCSSSPPVVNTPSTNCNMNCKGNSTETCGGPSAMDVWFLSSQPSSTTSTTSSTTSATSSTISASTVTPTVFSSSTASSTTTISSSFASLPPPTTSVTPTSTSLLPTSTTATSSPTPTVTTPNWSYVGCLRDTGNPRLLPNAVQNQTTSPVMTLELCINLCVSAGKGYTVMGVEYAQECWCGQALPAVLPTSNQCTMSCKGNSGEICGGPSALSAFIYQPVNNTVSSTTTATTSSIASSISSSVATASSTSSTLTSSSVISSAITTTTSSSITITSPSSSSSANSITSTISSFTLTTNSSSTSTLGSSSSTISSSSIVPVTSTSTVSSTLASISTSTSTATSSPTPTVTTPNWSYVGCLKDTGNPRLLPNAVQNQTTSPVMTLELCINLCVSANKGYTVMGVEYSQECWCAPALPAVVMSSNQCTMTCKGNSGEICGGPSALSAFTFVASNGGSNSSSAVITASPTSAVITSSSSTSSVLTSSSLIASTSALVPTTTTSSPTSSISSSASVVATSSPTPTVTTPNWSYVGCLQDSGNPRLFPNAVQNQTTSPVMTLELCINLCVSAGKGYTVMGVEYSQECWCAPGLPAAITNSNSCNMKCKGNSGEICGGPNALSAFMLSSPAGPKVIS